MLAHALTELIKDALLLAIGGALAELGWDVRFIIRNHSGRRRDDHT